ncbi:MAG TPA: hypothetical protein PLP17_10420 [Oligoflexia bacterium]|nr:hypothetical protein [Oligoflexia bacterium]
MKTYMREREGDPAHLVAAVSRCISHDLRTPLGTVLAVLADWKAGIALGPEDVEDAVSSANAMLQILNLLRDAGFDDNEESQNVMLTELAADSCAASGGGKLVLQRAGGPQAVYAVVQAKTVTRALTCVFRYLMSCGAACFELEAGRQDDLAFICFSVPCSVISKGSALLTSASLAEVFFVEQRARAIGMLYADLVLSRNRGQSEIQTDSGCVGIKLLFDTGKKNITSCF